MKIRYVNGFRIRNTLDIEFNELHQNRQKFSRFSSKGYIPKGEVWIDHIYRKSGEAEFFLKLETLSEKYFNKSRNVVLGKFRYLWQRTSKNVSQQHVNEALGWRKFLIQKLCKPEPVPEFIIKEGDVDHVRVIYVNGKIIREYFDPQFVHGGHDLVYSYVPKNEIWVDAVNDPKELKYILTHEKIEYELMKQGKSYDIAHEYALVAEKEARRLDGVGKYPGDEYYPWTNWPNEKIIRKFYVVK